MDGARHQPVGVSRLHHHDAVIHRIRDKSGRVFRGNTLRLAKFIEFLRVLRRFRAVRRIDQLDSFDRNTSLCGFLPDDLRVAKEHDFRQSFRFQNRRRLNGPSLFSFRKHDFPKILFRLFEDFFHHSHH